MNKPINEKLAKLLKDKGAEMASDVFYTNGYGLCELCGDGETLIVFTHPITGMLEVFYDVNGEFDEGERYYAPTVAEVLMWLYEKHDIWIIAVPSIGKGKWHYHRFDLKNPINDSEPELVEKYDSPNEALEHGIEYALTNLIK